MIDRARAVVIGSGIAGSSIAYHLTRLGWHDVLVLELGRPRSGTTSHAPGLVGQLRSSRSLMELLGYSVSLYSELQAGGEAGFSQVGSLRLASSKARLEELARQAGLARARGLEAELLGPRDVKRLVPPLATRGLRGGLYVPSDGSARALVLAEALARGAEAGGARFLAETPVTGFEVDGDRIAAVLTARGRIECEVAVIAAGIWSAGLGRLAGVSIPLVAMEHQYAVTAPLEELPSGKDIPNLRDPDKRIYMRQDGESLVIGGYEPDPVAAEGGIPTGPAPTVATFDPARFARLLEGARERMPVLGGAEVARGVSGLEAFTPDGEFILGECIEVRGLWAACGFCAHGVSGAGGVGRAVAEWIVEGEPSLDLWHMDIRRFGPHAGSRRYVRERALEVYSTYYSIALPGEERKSARELRRSPLYERLRALGAVFGEKAGWERAQWFRPNERLLPELEAASGGPWTKPRGWAARLWPRAVAAEHQSARTGAVLFDSSSFAKAEVSGPRALELLERVAANRMDAPVGSVTYTPLCNRRGGIECDVTVTRLDTHRFLIVSGTLAGPHDRAWLRRFLPGDGSVHVWDLTSSLACIGVAGPRSRALLEAASEDAFSNDSFPHLTARQVSVGYVPALALRIAFTGELGWELYTPCEYAATLWSTLWQAGRELGAVAAGYQAIESLRLEKGYPSWGADIDASVNPYEAGLAFGVDLEKESFHGRDALLEVRQEGIRRKLACLALDDPEAVALGGEPILEDGAVLGHVTSGGYGYTVRRSIALGYLPVEKTVPGARVAVELFGATFPATVTGAPLYDPAGARLKS